MAPTTLISAPPPATLSAYLASSLVAETKVNWLGGLLQYWENKVKAVLVLRRLVLDILTTPSLLVDVECAFLGGCMLLN
ncbi:hypothetical protein BN14_09104 [Rhizoctonia solani AG-1 IB]|uniref:HAT C-terminal dimerisation domain-containing protein n=1 Tax=Thanatephorus cucumeris (strain AG1-IB / isolate 7/3/14) TaxID=1108050 RepID=M5C6F6_THACB|nr:hypothetical protein BN14_09104 [Rhizoctonia solani AG-1 IB]